MTQINVMRRSDFDFGLTMANNEHWGYLREDYESLLALSPEGCFIAWKDKTPVGIITTLCHGEYGFIGTLIVLPEMRGHKIGESLMQMAINYLHDSKVTTIELDGVFPAVPLYRRLGFRDRFISLRLKRSAMKTRPLEPVQTSAYSIEEMCEFDFRHTGIDRSKLLNQFYTSFKDNLITIGQTEITGYAFIRPRGAGVHFIGPSVADSNQSVRLLYKAIMHRYGDSLLETGLPDNSQFTIDYLINNGFIHTQPALRMYLGQKPDNCDTICGIISPGKG
ncbi:MAG: GNAT family N-acetyltransferase [candidate division Zixibacteria bacterium]|nr:GNAT family N-acetyltransferase [candidate division Zixibacteria bacterium]